MLTKPYDAFLRATHPTAVLVLALCCGSFIAGTLGTAGRPDFGGISPPDFAFNASVIVLTVAFGWASRGQWLQIMWARLGVIEVFAYVSGALVLALGGSIVQGHLMAQAVLSAAWTSPPPVLMATVLAPLAESIMYQGWLQSTLENWIGARWALVLTAMAFLASHLHVSAPLVCTVLSLCFIRLRTGSLGTVILTHASINAAMYIFV